MPTYLSPQGKSQFFDINGDPLVGGKVYIYEAGTVSTPLDSYDDWDNAYAGTNPQSHPVVLDSRGEAVIIVNSPAKIVLKDSDDVLIWSVDNVAVTSSIIQLTNNGFTATIGIDPLTDDRTFTLPDSDGEDGQMLVTDGAGALDFAYPAVIGLVKATNSGNQSIPTGGTLTKLTFDTEVYDTDSIWVGGATSEYTPTIPGYYEFYFRGTVAAATWSIAVFSNTTSLGSEAMALAISAQLTYRAIFLLPAAGEKYTIRVAHSDAGSLNISGRRLEIRYIGN